MGHAGLSSPIAGLTAQHLARLGLGELALLPGQRAVDDSVFDALRWHDDALGATRQVVAPLTMVLLTDALGIEDRDVGRRALGKAAAVLQAKEIGGV